MPSKRRSSKRPYGQPHQELDVVRVQSSVGARRECGPGGEEYLVAVPRPSDKVFVCPACGQDIHGSTAHIVAWAADGIFGPDAASAERRHWHKNCWATFGRARG